MTKDKEVKKSETILERIKSGNRDTWANQAVKDKAFVNSDMWTVAQKRAADADGKSTPEPNEMKPARDQVIGMLIAQSPRFHAIGREDSDAKSSSHVASLFSYIWYISKGNVRFKKGCEDFEDIGMLAVMAYVDSFADNNKGEIKIVDVNPLNLYISDSKDPDTQDAVHKIISYPMTREKIKLLVPDFNFKEAQSSDITDQPSSGLTSDGEKIFESEDQNSDIDATKYPYIDRYTQVKHKVYHVEDLEGVLDKVFETEQEYIEWSRNFAIIVTKTNGEIRYVVREEDVQEILELVKEYGEIVHYMVDPQTGEPYPMSGFEHEGSIPNSTTRFEVVTMADLTNNGGLNADQPLVDRIRRVVSIGGKKVYNEVMPISRHPIVTGMNHHNRDPYPYGDARLTRPFQEQINKLDQLIITYLTNITNINMIVPRGGRLKKQLLEEAGKAGLKILEADYDVDAAPIIINWPPLPASITEMRQALIGQIQRIYGAYPFQEGNITTAPDSGKNTMILDEMGSRRSNTKRDSIYETINELAKVVMEMIPYVYTERKVIRVVSANHESSVKVINDPKDAGGIIEIMNDVSSSEVDVQVISGSMNPSNRAGEFDQLERIYQSGIIKNPAPIIKKMNLENVEEIIENEDALIQAQQTIQQLEQINKDLQGDLQTAQRSETEAEKKVIVQKTKTKLDKVVSDLGASAKIATDRLSQASKSQGEKPTSKTKQPSKAN